MKARDDLRARERELESVVVIPLTAKEAHFPGQDLQQPWVRMKEVIQELIDSDVVVVVPAGNGGERHTQVNILPALWESSAFPIVVGGAMG